MNATTELFGLKFPGKVGLAAGLDKNADAFPVFGALGFSFVEIGTVTPRPQPGNPKPRLFRLPSDKALINRMGFNSKGVDHAVEQLKKRPANLIIGGNIGKNTDTPNHKAKEDYLYCYKKLYNYVDYFVINISCPNIQNLHELQDNEKLDALLTHINEFRNTQEARKPTLLKVSPDANEEQLDDLLGLVGKHNIDGIVATNTTSNRPNLTAPKEQIERIGRGGLSGYPLKDKSTGVIRYIHKKTQGKLPVIAVGGIFSSNDALEKLNAGASLVQIYTGFIYKGPSLVREITKVTNV